MSPALSTPSADTPLPPSASISMSMSLCRNSIRAVPIIYWRFKITPNLKFKRLVKLFFSATVHAPILEGEAGVLHENWYVSLGLLTPSFQRFHDLSTHTPLLCFGFLSTRPCSRLFITMPLDHII